MFRAKEAGGERSYWLAGRAIDLAFLAALVASLASVFLIIWEYRFLSRTLAEGGPLLAPEARALRSGTALQLAAACAVAVTLALGLATTSWLRRKYSSSERSLRQVKLLASNILASTDRGVITTDRDGQITSVNSAAMRLLDLGIGCVGEPLEAVAPDGFPLGTIIRQVNDRRQPVRDRTVELTRDGRRLRFRLDGDVLADPDGALLGCVIHIEDTTERMLIDDRMRRMERFLGLATLASGLHHEIKNPLTALSIHVQLLEEALDRPQNTADLGELVAVLKAEIGRLNGVLESFRSFSHLQQLSLQRTNALEVVEEAIRLIRPQAAQQQVRITLLHPESELPPVTLDPDKFGQAVLNLVINALEAMPSGGNLTVSAAVEEAELRVCVTDSGPGIPPEVQKSLFLPYFSTKDKGSGMGLALSEKLINQHGGRIDFQTGPGETTFRIVVPLSQPAGHDHD